MLSESVVRGEGAAILLAFFWKDIPAIFSKKGKERKDGASKSVFTEEGVSRQQKREREKRKKRKKGILLSVGSDSSSRPWRKSKEKRRDSVLRNGSSLLQMRDPEEKKRETFSSAQGRISSRLYF